MDGSHWLKTKKTKEIEIHSQMINKRQTWRDAAKDKEQPVRQKQPASQKQETKTGKPALPQARKQRLAGKPKDAERKEPKRKDTARH